MTKYLVVLLLAAVMVVTISLIDSRSIEQTELSQQRTDAVSSPNRIYATGLVEGATEDIHLRPELLGRVTEVLVAAGDCVAEGDVLVRQDGARHQQEVALAQAKLALATAELDRLRNGAREEERQEARAMYRAAFARLQQAERTWNRIQQLRSQQAIPEQEADDQLGLVNSLRAELEAAEARVKQLEAPAREDEVRAAEARVAAAQAELDLAKIYLAKSELRSPRRGCVLDVNVEPGELTGPDAVEPLVVLSDTSVVRVRAYVEELDAPRVRIGMPASITVDGLPGTTFTGRVVSLSPRMTPKSVFADRPSELYDMKVREVLLELEATTQLIVGLRVDVSFDVQPYATPAEAAEELLSDGRD